MDTVLLILGVLGAGAVIISAYVFIVAARNYVSDNPTENSTADSLERAYVVRSRSDRREKLRFDFPMTVNGMLVPIERRGVMERRSSLA